MVVLLSMTACEKNGDAIKSITTTTTTSITTTQSENEQPEIEPLPVPEGGWTAEELAKTIRINGELISIPFTIDSLGEGYTYSEESDCIECEGVKIAFVSFIEEVESTDYQKVEGFSAYKNITNNMLTVNGASLGSSRSDVEKAFGTPTKVNDNICGYCNPNEDKVFLVVDYDENDKISTLIIHHR